MKIKNVVQIDKVDIKCISTYISFHNYSITADYIKYNTMIKVWFKICILNTHKKVNNLGNVDTIFNLK